MIRVSRKKMMKRRRALLTIIAVAVSMALLVSMLSVAEGIKDFTFEEVERSYEDVVLTSAERHGITQGHVIAKDTKEWPEVKETLPRLTDFLSINASGSKRFAIAEGVLPDQAWKFIPSAFKDRFDGWFNNWGDPHYENNYTGPFTYEVLVSRALANDFELDIGDTIGLSKSSNGQETDFTINGTFDSDFSGDGVFEGYYFIILHLSELQSILDLDKIGDQTVDIVDSVSFNLEAGYKSNKAGLKEFIEKFGNEYPLYKGSLLTKEQRLDQLEGFVDLANGFNLGIGIVAVVIGTLFVACVMVISVYERTQVIGIMRAIGISKRSIFVSIFRESFIIVSIGSFVGLLPGYLISDTLGKYLTVSYGLSVTLSSFTPLIVLKALILTVTIGTVASLFPGWLATRMNVIRALKHIR